MTTVTDMFRTYPADLGAVDRTALSRCVEECLTCSQTCTACADACLSEADDQLPTLRTCIRATEDCADVCATTARVLTRHTGYDANVSRAVLEACALVCRSCADECEPHAERHEHCRVCAAACRSCERACHDLLRTLG